MELQTGDVASIDVDQKLCTKCHVGSEPSFNFCPFCGTDFSGRFTGLPTRDPLIGAVVADRYRLLAKLGVGGMGTVYKVEHVRMGKVMAMKLLHGDLSRDENMVRRFTREARAISRMRGRHSVQVFDFGCADGLFYIVMEYLQGKDLGALLGDHSTLTVARTARLIHQVVEGVSEAHEQDIIHRDIKPENIFICASTQDEEEIAKVLDFGLAKLKTRSSDESIVGTKHGLILGTPHYMSPEQIEGHEVTVATDIYSTGALIFKTLTGRPPYPGNNPIRILNSHLDDPIPRIGAIKPELAFLDQFFFSALAKQPEQRFKSIRALDAAFRDAIKERNQSSSSELKLEPVEGNSSDPGRLLPKLSNALIANLATSKDFDHFEWSLRFRRIGLVLLTFSLLVGAVWAVIWGVVMGNFYDHSAEAEPNDSLKSANDLRSGRPLLAAIGEPPSGVRADRDFFRVLGVEAGQVLSVQVSGVPGLDLVVEVVNANGERLLIHSAQGDGYGETIPNFRVGEEPLYLVVREMWKQGEKTKAKPDEWYSISIDSRNPMPGEEHEPNENTRLASSFLRGKANGMLSRPDDVDVYRFDRMSGLRSITVDVTGLPTTDLTLELQDSTGRRLSFTDDAGLEKGERLVAALDVDQINQPIFLLVASERGFSSDCSYTVEFVSQKLGDQDPTSPLVDLPLLAPPLAESPSVE